MSKRFTKIICSAVAVISAASFLAFVPGCSNGWKGADANDTATEAVAGTNGGFVVETENYAYFINGKSENTQTNSFGSVVKGSVQRISKEDLSAHNYTNTTTIVPSVIYSGNEDYNAGLYIYGGYLYYTTPSTQMNSSGEVLNTRLDFKRTKLDGTDTTNGYIWQSEDNTVDYRYVEVDGVVYIFYAMSENLYGSEKTNIHSINCETGKDTLLAYGVSSYSFDTENPENPYVYYTMAVPQAMGESSTLSYNQLYRVKADVTESPRSYDFSGVEDYDAETDPVYVNMGDFVFDGISKMAASKGLTQFNYGYGVDGVDQKPTLSNGDYTYDIQWYKNGELYFTRKDSVGSTYLYKLADGDITADRNAITANEDAIIFIRENYTTNYTFVTMDNVLYAVETGSSGIFKKPMTYDAVSNSYSFGDSIKMSDDSSATVLFVKEEGGHIYLYYSMTGSNGYSINRIAIEGNNDAYNKLPDDNQSADELPDYRSVQVLDLDACSGWYMPEFVGNTLLFASEVEGMSDFNYIMACDLKGANGIMTNNEIEKLNERYEAIEDRITDYNTKTNSDGSKTYENLAGALRYEFYTRDGEYLGELMQAFVDVEGKELYHYYSEESVQIAKDFMDCTGEWATDADGNAYLTKTVNGEEIKSNKRDYYYSLVGQMSEDDATAYLDYFKNNTAYMKAYPVDNSTWWEKLSTGGKVGFIIGMVAAGLVVIGGVTVLVVFLVRRKKNKGGVEDSHKMKVDISDDKNIDVYGEDKDEDRE
ncbi:MAG: hypothetical protein ACI4MN_01435 [Candidatus Coproplasma sp.]